MENLATEQGTIFYLLRDRPGVLVIYAVLVLIICITIILLKYPKFLNGIWKRRAEDIEAGKQVHLADRQGLVTMIENTIGEVTSLKQQFRIDLDEIVNFYMGTTRRFTENDMLIKKSTIFGCISVIYGSNIPIGYKLDAALSYFKLHGNGNVREHVVKLILQEPNGRQHWSTALNADIQENGVSEDKFFKDTICWIEAKVNL